MIWFKLPDLIPPFPPLLPDLDLHNATNDYDRALEALDIAVKLDPTSSEAYNTKGFALNAKNDFANAIKEFDMAIRLNPNDARYYNNRGFAYNGLHEYGRGWRTSIELSSLTGPKICISTIVG